MNSYCIICQWWAKRFECGWCAECWRANHFKPLPGAKTSKEAE